jgi:hypothetical protein
MTSRRHRRTTWATGLSLVLHALALTGMVVGLKVVAPPTEDRAIELHLIPTPRLQPPPESVHRRSGRTSVAAPLRARPTPQLPTESPIAAPPEAPAPVPAAGIGPQVDGESKGLLPGFRERLGCDDPAPFHLTTEQRKACVDQLARIAKDAKPLALDIPDQKRAAYDYYVYCAKLHKGPIPSMSDNKGMGDPATWGRCLMGTW